MVAIWERPVARPARRVAPAVDHPIGARAEQKTDEGKNRRGQKEHPRERETVAMILRERAGPDEKCARDPDRQDQSSARAGSGLCIGGSAI